MSLAGRLFIPNALIAAGDADRRDIANYPSYFDASWKHGLQLVLAAGIVGVFWLRSWLGAELFRLIQIEYPAELIKRPWFWIPVTTLVVTYALHATDVRVGMTRGARTLALTLLSWLLPLMAAMALAFLGALPFTGLEPLWNTRRATALLLTATAALVFLINEAYQDGRTETITPVLRYVHRGGWSHPGAAGDARRLRPGAAGGAVRLDAATYHHSGMHRGRELLRGRLCACRRAVRQGAQLDRTTNVAAALVVLATLLALATPTADPARLSVADQVARLERPTSHGLGSTSRSCGLEAAAMARRHSNDSKRKRMVRPPRRFRSRRTKRWTGGIGGRYHKGHCGRARKSAKGISRSPIRKDRHSRKLFCARTGTPPGTWRRFRVASLQRRRLARPSCLISTTTDKRKC